jgi:predicted enzyme related to lactoylglutathione lyase
VFGWEALEPSPEFGGYFMFARNGNPTAGGMGDMGEMRADNAWKIYLHTDDIERTVTDAKAKGAQVFADPMAVADLGKQAVLADPTGATVGAWEPGTFPGFITVAEKGAPSWFELQTRDVPAAVDFYTTVFGTKSTVVSDTGEFRYTVLVPADGGDEIAGIMDASSFLPEGVQARWLVYWHVDDVDGAAAKVKEHGGTILDEAQDTPYGRIATATDPTGAQFKLRTPPAA